MGEATGGISWPGKGREQETFRKHLNTFQQGTRCWGADRYHASWQQSLTASRVVTVLKIFVSQFLVSHYPGLVPHHVDG